MSVQDGGKFERLRDDLRGLFQAAGYERQELLQWVDTYERESAALERAAALAEENERLKRELRKLRTMYANGMSSRLKDALRE